ncbi:MAG: transposase [Bacteroidales bacterium]
MPRGTNYKKLMLRRDKKLCERYYYWFEVKRLRYDDVLKTLSEDEFFISEQRIVQIIRNNNEYIDRLFAADIKSQLKLF